MPRGGSRPRSLERVRESLVARSAPDPLTGCVHWQGPVNRKGYGKFWFNGTSENAHRVAWKITHGPIPDGMHVCHHCDNPRCVNVGHLFLGTIGDNMRDRTAKRRQAWGERNGNAKLAVADVLRIRMRLASGEPGSEIARAFLVSKNAVSRIRLGRSWNLLPGEVAPEPEVPE